MFLYRQRTPATLDHSRPAARLAPSLREPGASQQTRASPGPGSRGPQRGCLLRPLPCSEFAPSRHVCQPRPTFPRRRARGLPLALPTPPLTQPEPAGGHGLCTVGPRGGGQGGSKHVLTLSSTPRDPTRQGSGALSTRCPSSSQALCRYRARRPGVPQHNQPVSVFTKVLAR